MELDDLNISVEDYQDKYTTLREWMDRVSVIQGHSSIGKIMEQDGEIFLKTDNKDIKLNIDNPTEIGEIIIAEIAKKLLDGKSKPNLPF